jgi:pimeloyl-ACP methyl ester carboxylesterase
MIQTVKQRGSSMPGASGACMNREKSFSARYLCMRLATRVVVIEQAGHFLQLERPGEVNEHILAWVTG